MQENEIKEILDRYLKGESSPEEKLQVELWYSQSANNSNWSLDENEVEATRARILAKLNDQIDRPVVKKMTLWPRIAAAASIILCLGAGAYFYFHSKADQQIVQNKPYKNDLLPGGNKAYLTLSDGKRITLTGAANGKIAQQSGIIITKTADGQLVYEAAKTAQLLSNAEIKYNTIETPKGGQYQVILPDGSHVWLNAASSLKYPTAFAGNERKVELTGEAYFEVMHNAAQPFRVATNGQVVEDIGTRFDINSYADEPSTVTTLLEGAVRINDKTVLKPGQQARLAPTGKLTVNDTDTDEAIAWKNGYFQFSQEPLQSIMRKISRWYNVDIIFDSEGLKQQTFSGTISRLDKVSKVLHRLELTKKVQFKIEQNTIRVMYLSPEQAK